MRAHLFFALLLILGAAWAIALDISAGATVEANIGSSTPSSIPDTTTGIPAEENLNTSVPVATGYRVHISAPQDVQYTYLVEGNSLILTLAVFRGTPCEKVSVETETRSKNRFKVVVTIRSTAEPCIQVIPPPTEQVLRFSLDPEYPDVYVDIEVNRSGEITKRPAGTEENAEENIGMPHIYHPYMPDLIEAKCRALKAKIQAAEENKEAVEALKEEYQRMCSSIMHTPTEPTLPRIGIPMEDPCAVAEKMKRELEENASKELNELVREWMERCSEYEPNTPEGIINKIVVATQTGIREVNTEALKKEVTQLRNAIKELQHELEKAQEQLEIMARHLATAVRVEPGKLVVGNEELNIPKAEIVVDENKGIKVRIGKGEIILEENGVKVHAEIGLDISPEGELVSTESRKPIKVQPKDVLKRVEEKVRAKITEVKKIALEDSGKGPKYVVEGEEEGKLLGIIPVKLTVKAEVNAESGEVISVEKPWWAFLVFG